MVLVCMFCEAVAAPAPPAVRRWHRAGSAAARRLTAGAAGRPSSHGLCEACLHARFPDIARELAAEAAAVAGR